MVQAAVLTRDFAQRDGRSGFLSAAHHNALDDVEGARGRLEQLGRKLQGLGAQIERAVMGRASRHHGGA